MIGNYSAAELPLDTIWSDIDYMDKYKDFTVDPINFGKMNDFVDQLHAVNLHYVPILDGGIAVRDNYNVYKQGLDQGLFMKAPDSDKPFVGQVWPNDAVWLDFFKKGASELWQSSLSALHDLTHFDGIWLDMNEASNFCGDQCYFD